MPGSNSSSATPSEASSYKEVVPAATAPVAPSVPYGQRRLANSLPTSSEPRARRRVVASDARCSNCLLGGWRPSWCGVLGSSGRVAGLSRDGAPRSLRFGTEHPGCVCHNWKHPMAGGQTSRRRLEHATTERFCAVNVGSPDPDAEDMRTGQASLHHARSRLCLLRLTPSLTPSPSAVSARPQPHSSDVAPGSEPARPSPADCGREPPELVVLFGQARQPTGSVPAEQPALVPIERRGPCRCALGIHTLARRVGSRTMKTNLRKTTQEREGAISIRSRGLRRTRRRL